MPNVLPSLPSINELLESPPLRSLVQRVNRNVVVSSARRLLDDLRTRAQSAAAGISLPTAAELAQRIADWIAAEQVTAMRPTINATGILLPAGSGGPPLAAEAIAALAAAAGSYSGLAASSGDAVPADNAVERLLARLSGAEAALIVGSHASAMLLALTGLAQGKEIVVARGQLVELDDDYRLPRIVAASGAVLREVGATNVSRASDYSAAIGDQTAAIVRVHPSNYAIDGRAEQATLAELAALARKHKLSLVADLGCGSLIDLSPLGIRGEPVATNEIQGGADLVVFAGQRLLGGPPCGLIAGRATLIERLAGHPLAAALRADRLTLAALDATLRLYPHADLAERSIPLLSLLATSPENLKNRAERLAPQIAATGIARAEVVEGQAYWGSACIAAQALPTWQIVLTPAAGGADKLLAALKTGATPVLGRPAGERVVLDLRTVLPRQDGELVAACEALAKPKPSPSPAAGDQPPAESASGQTLPS